MINTVTHHQDQLVPMALFYTHNSRTKAHPERKTWLYTVPLHGSWEKRNTHFCQLWHTLKTTSDIHSRRVFCVCADVSGYLIKTTICILHGKEAVLTNPEKVTKLIDFKIYIFSKIWNVNTNLQYNTASVEKHCYAFVAMTFNTAAFMF